MIQGIFLYWQPLMTVHNLEHSGSQSLSPQVCSVAITLCFNLHNIAKLISHLSHSDVLHSVHIYAFVSSLK